MSEIVFNAPSLIQSEPIITNDLHSQVENLQTTLASLNQQVIILQEALQERDQEIADLKERFIQSQLQQTEEQRDNTLTIVGVLINLYKLAFPPGKTQ